ncbi:hypothetical protein [Microbacterium sp. Root180]|nr:hypothetical protein [Microbacterium sp. Root180]
MLDVIYLVTTLALFALVGLIAKGAERLVARAGSSAPRGEERS